MRKLLLALSTALVVAAPAGAAELRGLDLSEYPVVEVTAVSAGMPSLRENGQPVAGLEAQNLGRAKSVVLAVDRSQSMAGDALPHAVEAARRFVGAKPDDDRVAVVAFGSGAVQLTGFSSATIDADIALSALAVDAEQGTALHDAVVLASRSLAAETAGARVLILLTDGTDVSSRAGAAEAVAAARGAGVAVYGIGIEGPQFAPDPLRALAERTGGSYYGAASPAALSAVYAQVAAELERTWRLRYVTAARPGEEIALEAGGAPVSARAPGRAAAVVRREPSGLLPARAYESPLGSLAVGGAVGALLLVAAALAAGAKRGSWLRTRLAPHVDRDRLARRAAERERFAAGSTVMRATESAFGHLRFWRATERLLERADVPLRAVELLYASATGAIVLGLLAAVAAQSSIVVLLALATGGAVPFGYLRFRAARRRRAFENQLPDLLLTLAASLKAGHSFKQGLQTVVDEGQPPASKEFKRVLTEAQLGRPMDDALAEMAQRVGSKNLDFVISAVTIQGQVGGSLAGLFDMVAEAVRQRQQFARKVRGLTAMGRASAYVLVGIPFFLAGTLTVINREYMDPLYNTSTGHWLIGIGLTMMAVGSMFLRKIVAFRG